MKIAVIGAGALGLYYGAKLQRAGNDVQFLLRRDFQAIIQKGLAVTSPKGNFHLGKVKGFRDVAEMDPVDLVLVGLKTFANHQLVALVAPLMHEGCSVITLQNGLGNEELLAAAFGAERVLGSVAYICANRGESGTVHHLDTGHIQIGEFVGGLSIRTAKISDMFNSAGIECEAVADLTKAHWEKLVWNIPFNGLCTLTNKTTSELLAHAPSRAEVRAIMFEVILGGNAQGLSAPITEAFIDEMMAVTDAMDNYQPSMMIDRHKGRPLELETIYKIPINDAAKQGVKMTRVSMLHALLSLGEHVSYPTNHNECIP
jgi:2-dehydropantoate 2-reductase